MKSWLGIALVLAACAVIGALWLFVRSPEPRNPSPPVVSTDVAALEAEIARLRSEIERTRAVPVLSEPSPAALDLSHDEPAPLPIEPTGTGRAPAVPPRVVDVDTYLDEYAASVIARDESEHYRHLVAAYVVELAPRISALVRDERTPLALRMRLIELLGDRRLKGQSIVIDALLAVVRGPLEERLVTRALAALRSIGDRSAASGVEATVWSVPTHTLRRAAIDTVLMLVADDRNEVLRRLLSTAPNDGMRTYVVSLLDPERTNGVLSVFDLASRMEQPVRLAAAHKIGGFTDPAVAAFIQRWLGFETDAAVRAALASAAKSAATTPSWHARQAIGPPDASPGRDDPKAWASASGDMGEQWLELGYTPARRCNAVRVYEVNSPGAVIAVVGIEESGAEHTLWAGADPLSQPGVFEITFPTTSYAVRRLRVVLDTNATPDWNEIDCVELVGPDGRAWASEARASSWFGGGS